MSDAAVPHDDDRDPIPPLPAVHAHTGFDLRPCDVEDLPADVQRTVEQYQELAGVSGAAELEVRHYGKGNWEIVLRWTEEAGDGE